MKKIIKLLIIIIFVTTFLMTGVAWYFSSSLMYPDANCNKDHYIYCGEPNEQKLSFEDFTVTTTDNVNLTGWYMPTAKSKKGIILVHGHGGTIHEGMRYAKILIKSGFNVAAFSLRGNMKDTKKSFYSMGYHEQKDIKAIIDFLIQKKGLASIGIFGFSMGASTAILAMSKDHRIKAGIFNSAFSDVREQLTDVAREKYGLPSFPLINIVLQITEYRGNIDFSTSNAVDHIAEISPRPIFIWHSRGDDEVMFKHGEKLYQAAKEPKLFWQAPYKKHVREWNWDRKTSEGKAISFFKKHL